MSAAEVKETLTDDDLSAIVYYWQERGDLERWGQWREVAPLVREELPELWHAWLTYLNACSAITAIVNKISDRMQQ